MADFVVPDLKIAPWEGNARGQEGFEQILRAALAALIEEGAKGLTMRGIAARCGLKAGNLAYYFKSKEDLIRELLNAIISSYEEVSEPIMHDSHASAETRLERILLLWMDDVATKKTTRVFPELWAMANHDPFVQDLVDAYYRRGRIILENLIAEINPSFRASERAALALFMTASMEGMTMFVGYEKADQDKRSALRQIAVKSFLHMITTLRPGEIPEDERPAAKPPRSRKAARK